VKPNCKVPKAIEVVVSLLMHYIKTGERLMSSPGGYTSCDEFVKSEFGSGQLTVGFTFAGFMVGDLGPSCSLVGFRVL